MNAYRIGSVGIVLLTLGLFVVGVELTPNLLHGFAGNHWWIVGLPPIVGVGLLVVRRYLCRTMFGPEDEVLVPLPSLRVMSAVAVVCVGMWVIILVAPRVFDSESLGHPLTHYWSPRVPVSMMESLDRVDRVFDAVLLCVAVLLCLRSRILVFRDRESDSGGRKRGRVLRLDRVLSCGFALLGLWEVCNALTMLLIRSQFIPTPPWQIVFASLDLVFGWVLIAMRHRIAVWILGRRGRHHAPFAAEDLLVLGIAVLSVHMLGRDFYHSSVWLLSSLSDSELAHSARHLGLRHLVCVTMILGVGRVPALLGWTSSDGPRRVDHFEPDE